MRVGCPEYATMNQRLNKAFEYRNVLIATHRGLSGADLVDNTSPAIEAALRSNTDIVEIDIVQSRDGKFYAFHEGLEAFHLGISEPLGNLTSEEIDSLRYLVAGERRESKRVENLQSVLETFADRTIFNLDKGWEAWADLLPFLVEVQVSQSVLLKAPFGHPNISLLSTCSTKFPFMPICAGVENVEAFIEWYLSPSSVGINVVGVELLVEKGASPAILKKIISQLSKHNLFCFANAEVVSEDKPLFNCWDDNVSLCTSPELGWGKMVDVGVTVVQTDWPLHLHNFLEKQQTFEAIS